MGKTNKQKLAVILRAWKPPLCEEDVGEMSDKILGALRAEKAAKKAAKKKAAEKAKRAAEKAKKKKLFRR